MTIPTGAMRPETFIKYAEEKKLATRALCDSLFAYLTVDIEHMLQESHVKHHRTTLEDLERAQKGVEEIEEQIAKIEEVQDDLPDSLAPLVGMTLPALRGALRQAIEYREYVQHTLEDEADSKEVPA